MQWIFFVLEYAFIDTYLYLVTFIDSTFYTVVSLKQTIRHAGITGLLFLHSRSDSVAVWFRFGWLDYRLKLLK